VEVSFIGWGNWSTGRNPATCRNSLTNFITYVVSSTPPHQRDLNSQQCIMTTVIWYFRLHDILAPGSMFTHLISSTFIAKWTSLILKLFLFRYICIGSGYFLIDPINTIHCCGQITMWHYKPVKTGTIAFGIWRKTHVNNIYKLVGVFIMTTVIWYFRLHDILAPGSMFTHLISSTFIAKWTSLILKLFLLD
jgi:hypothetical protein